MANISGTARGNSLAGTSGRDTINGGAGNDRLVGKNGNDLLNGGGDRDTLSGGDGNDSLHGGGGHDSIYGGDGRDWIYGEAGNDLLVGNAGADVFILGSGMDTIKDWNADQGDVVDLRAALGNYNPNQDDIADFVEVVYNYGGRTSTIGIDANGARNGHHFVEIGLLKDSTYAHVHEMVAAGALLVPGSSGLSGSDGFEFADSRASQFGDYLGVSVQIGSNHPSNSNANPIIDSLDYLGVTNVRTAVEAPIGGNKAPIYDAMADAGIDFNFMMRRGFPAKGKEYNKEYIDHFKDFLKEHPGSIKAIESINEVGSSTYKNLRFDGNTGDKAATEYQKFLYNMINSDNKLKDIPVLNFSVFFGREEENFLRFDNVAKHSDAATAHVYIKTALQPYYELMNRIDHAQILNNGGPAVITETGYPSNALRGNALSVDQQTQAKLVLNMIMDGYEQGVDNLYIYELFDDHANDPSRNESNFGLFGANGAPKVAADAIHNLTTVIGRHAGNGGTVSVGYDIDGADEYTHSFALEKKGGVTDLIIWREDLIWDKDTAHRINVPSQTIDVDFNKTVDHVRVYDPMEGTNVIKHVADTDGISIQISDHPIILELGL